MQNLEAGGPELRMRLDAIEREMLGDRAAGFEALHDELLTELQQGDESTVLVASESVTADSSSDPAAGPAREDRAGR